ncbi:mxaK protein [Methylophilaceae bacterium]|nr:mxaK protein [Methylophilaceae bacterium]
MALSVKKVTWTLTVFAIASAATALYEWNRIGQIDAFNRAILSAKTPETDKQSYEAKFSTAYWLARNERYKEATLLFLQLAESGDNNKRSAVQHNLGNIFFLRGLAINGNSMTVRNETEYLFRQAKGAYVQSVKLDNSHWDTRHNLDRVIGMLPDTPTPGVGESDTPGLIMGNIPVGLP